MKRERDPTPEELEKLDAWLASVGKDYVAMHQRLTKIFAYKGCFDAEMLADEVLSRVAVRIDEQVQKYDSPVKCLLGVADNVYHEYLRDPDRQRRKDIDSGSWQRIPSPNPNKEVELDKELKHACLEECLAELSDPDRNLFCRYFQQDELRKLVRGRLAEELKLTANALRIRAHRLRGRMRECMDVCVAKNQEGLK